MMRFSFRLAFYLMALVLLPGTVIASSTSKLGNVHFPTSGKGNAQEHFVRGVAALHSFWYAEALEAFRKSTKADPGFIMGYWGEAMAHNHPLWEEQETSQARKVIAQFGDLSNLTGRERAYVNAVKALYGKGDKESRDAAYASAMEQIHRAFPDDLEATCFYSLSLLGLARHSENKMRLQVKAGALALDVFTKEPEHPCAAHYAIHAFDHPDLAILALPSAKRYARIAPESHHAQHMPAHIFVQLGMWTEAQASNEAGWQNSVDWVRREGLPMKRRDYHSLQWLHYVYLQQGQYQKADAVLQKKLDDMKIAKSKADCRVGKYYERMVAAAVLETERWDLAEKYSDSPGCELKPYSRAGLHFVLGFAAARLGHLDSAKNHLKELNTIRKKGFEGNHFNRSGNLEVWALEIKAALALSEKKYDSAIKLARKATDVEKNLPPPSGPPRILKPGFEFLGEVLLQAGKLKEADKAFTLSLLRHPNRTRSLIGMFHTSKALKDKSKVQAISQKIRTNFKSADPAVKDFFDQQQ